MTGPAIRFRLTALCAAALMGAALLTGCGGKDDDDADRPKSARAAGAAKDGAAGATGAASITGKTLHGTYSGGANGFGCCNPVTGSFTLTR